VSDSKVVKAANKARNVILLLGWSVIMIWGVYFTNYFTPPPAPIKVTPSTETSIRNEIRRENDERKIKRSIATARKVYRANGCRDVYSEITGRTAFEFGLSPRLLAAVVFVESSCRANAVSGRASVGLLQVNPLVWGHKDELKDPEKNMKIGAKILKTYISRYGVVEGLHAYNGFGNKTNEYSTKVLTIAGEIGAVQEQRR